MERQKSDRELGKRVFHLKTLHDLSREIFILRDLHHILQNLLMMTMGNFGATSGVVYLVDSKRGEVGEIVHRGMTDSAISRLTKALAKGKIAKPSIRILVPFQVEEEISGGIGLGGKLSGESYTPDDRELLETIAAQGAVAIGNASLLEQLGKRIFHLKTLYDVSQEIGFLLDPREILHHLLMMTLGNFGAERGIALLVDKGHDRMEVVTHTGVDEKTVSSLQEAMKMGPIAGFFDLSSRKVFGGKDKVRAGRGKKRNPPRLSDILPSIGMRIWIPLSVNEEISGGIGLGEKIVGEPYTSDDQELLDTLAAQGAVAIKNAKLMEQMKKDEIVRVNLARYLSPQIVDQIVSQDVQVNLGGDRKVVTVLFSDIRKFTTITESRPPDQLVAILNEYFTEMAKIIFDHQGSLDKYIGDAIVAVFGSLIPVENPARNAVAASVAMMNRLPEMNRDWEARFGFSMNIGIGISTGEVFLGNVGSPERMEFTVIGDTVNVASRFSGLARAGQILVTRETLSCLGPEARHRELPATEVKGKTGKLEVFEIPVDPS